MGTQFWVIWGPNGDLRHHKWGPKKRIFKIDQNELISWNKEEINNGKNIFTECGLIWCTDLCRFHWLDVSPKIHLFKWSTYSWWWMSRLLTRSSAWNRQNGDLWRKWGPFGDPKTEKGPHGDPGPQMGTQVGAVGKVHVCFYENIEVPGNVRMQRTLLFSTAPTWVPIWRPGSPWGPFSVFGSPLGPHWVPLGPHFLF